MKIETLRSRLLEGLAIPACPLALHENRDWSERHQRAIIRYYLASGVGGIAVGVHSTQFAIRDPSIGLLEPVLRLVSEEMDALGSNAVKIAGICGATKQAILEAESAIGLGYEGGLLSLKGVQDHSEDQILRHCRTVAEIIPVIGFYLQPAVGGQEFSFQFWRQFAEIQNVVAIKIAPFNRYQTWDVVRAVIESGRDEIALYTGNDDNIIIDLLIPFVGFVNGEKKRRFIDGGLLGQWGVGTRCAVRMFEEIKSERKNLMIDSKWLTSSIAVTDFNAALFDAANQFAGCIPGIMEVLRRDRLLPSITSLDPNEKLSSGQLEELERVTLTYPELMDTEFIAEHVDAWLD